MASTKSLWFRLYTEILNDPKVQTLSDKLFRVYINTLCIAKEYNQHGALPGMVSVAFYLRVDASKAESVLIDLVSRGLLDKENDVYMVHGWTSRQYESDGDPTRYDRVKRYRNALRPPEINTRETLIETHAKRVSEPLRNTSVNLPETETETETENKEKEGPQASPSPSEKSCRFTKPTAEEVATYCAERGNGINGQTFVDYYESNGWRVGRSAMKDWRAAVRNWERRNSEQSKPQAQQPARRTRLVFKAGQLCPLCKTPLPHNDNTCPKCEARLDYGCGPEMFEEVQA